MINREKGPWKFPEGFKNIKGIKNIKIRKDRLLIVFLAGLLLLVIALPGENKEKDKEESSFLSGNEAEGSISEDVYISRLEKRLADILSQMEGAGEVSVMITLESSAEKVVEKDLESGDETVTESDSQGGSRVSQNRSRREEAVYDTEGNSRQSPYISKELSPRVEGVVVIASGGDDALVVKNITEAVQALFGIDTHKIRIVKGRRAEQ